jgi:excisionase family DNA binding protein
MNSDPIPLEPQPGDVGGRIKLARRTDPYEALGAALRAVVEEAVAGALASVKAVASVEPVMVSVPDAAERLGVGTTKLKELVASGRLQSVVIGRRRLIPMAGLNAFAGDETDTSRQNRA